MASDTPCVEITHLIVRMGHLDHGLTFQVNVMPIEANDSLWPTRVDIILEYAISGQPFDRQSGSFGYSTLTSRAKTTPIQHILLTLAVEGLIFAREVYSSNGHLVIPHDSLLFFFMTATDDTLLMLHVPCI